MARIEAHLSMNRTDHPIVGALDMGRRAYYYIQYIPDRKAQMGNKSEEKPKTKFQTWTERVLGALFGIPFLVMALVGLISVTIKVIQICVAWIS